MYAAEVSRPFAGGKAADPTSRPYWRSPNPPCKLKRLNPHPGIMSGGKMRLATWLGNMLTPPPWIRTWLKTRLGRLALQEQALPLDAAEDELPPPRLRELLSQHAEPEAADESEESLTQPRRLREMLTRSTALTTRLAPSDRLKELLQPKTR